MKPPSTARTAGRSGGCGGACDASRLSCFLFRPRKRLEKRRKRSHTNVSNALVTRTSRLSQTLLQTPLPCFHASINEYYTAKNGLGTIAPRLLSRAKAGTHSPSPTGSHTAAYTPKHGVFPPSSTAGLCAASEIAAERTAGESGCTSVACVRFLRRRGPAGLCKLIISCLICNQFLIGASASPNSKFLC